MADLSQLFQVAPLTAGYMTGENHAMDREANALKQQELAQTLQKLRMEMEQSQQMSPLKMEYQRLLNENTGAQIRDHGLSAQNRAFDLKRKEALLPGEQAEAARKGREGALKEKDDALNSATKALHQMGVVFSGPEPFPGAHAASLRQGLEERLGADHPLVKNIMGQVEKVGPGQLGKFFKDLAVQAKEQDPKHLGQVELETLRQTERNNRQDSVNETALTRATMQSNRPPKAAPTPEERLGKEGIAMKQYNMLTLMIAKAKSKEEEMELRRQREAVRPAAMLDFQKGYQARPDPKSMNIDTVPPPQLPADPLLKSTTPGSASSNDVQKAVEAAGEKYEPTKYEYRISNGKVQKRKKE